MTQNQSSSSDFLAFATPVAMAFNALLYPHAEIVLHDLKTGEIAAIWNSFSGRKSGDLSLLDDDPECYATKAILGPYEKAGDNGQKLKSVTAILRNAQGTAGALLCINLDVSQLDVAQRMLAAFITPQQNRPDALFARDPREQISFAFHQWLQKQQLAASALKKADKIALVSALEARGLFETRYAAEHLATLMGSSRATIYNYLSEIREQKTS
ncbi:PAS domain-containing protein [Pseudochrobactrum sp. sp1633]|uniref:helix-turn-helix transcriptional regulator n=1 Tax=Pseudochrobactrum sp. sp1633 TaxID=3036706 RepID=UPI0025A68859|nr:PAS domain-containing protein [Pseudochrobactrum sp. sp1633]MDM8345202.1 PAS domain-containing protein [Pseudochrobactrum sp. sp1633]HWD12947.1 PAS domain-containing protein [Pseudochrobactrum sp.]